MQKLLMIHKLDEVGPLITDPPPSSSTTLSKKKKKKVGGWGGVG